MPVEIDLRISWWVISLFCILSNEKAGRLCLDVQEQELAPVQIQLKGGLVGVNLGEGWGDISLLNQTGANTIGDSSDQALLSRLLVGVNTKNVLALRFGLVNFLDHPSQIGDVHSGDQVLTLANDGKVIRVLQPGLLKVGVKDGFTLTVEETSSDNVGLNVIAFEVQNVFLGLADASVLLRSASHLVVCFSEGKVEHLLLLTRLLVVGQFRLLGSNDL